MKSNSLKANIGDDYNIQSGCVVLMEVQTGAIRAMVNLSRGTASYETERLWERYNDAIAHLYEPGEVIQTMTLAPVLRDRFVISLDDEIPTLHGFLPHYPQDIHLMDYERTNKTDKISILYGYSISSRYAMGYLATSYYNEAQEYFAEGIRSMCYPERTGFEIEGLHPVDITNPRWYYWKKSSLPSLANGYCLTMTHMDIPSYYNTIANRGRMVRPYLVESVGSGRELDAPHKATIINSKKSRNLQHFN